MAFLYFVVYLISQLILGANSRELKGTCNGTQFTNVCTSCTSIILCASNTTSTCTGGQVCLESGGLALCTSSSNVPQCQCTDSSGISYQCDPYNDAVAIACFDGVIQSSAMCPDEQVCVQSTEQCGTPPETTTTPTTTPAPTDPPRTTCATSSLTPIKSNCTAFYFCAANQVPVDRSCNDSQIFSDNSHNCIEYRNFICAEDAPGMMGLFADPRNCSIYYTCLVDGTQGTTVCPNGEYFDQTMNGCIKNDGACVDEICTPCKAEGNVFPVESTTCVSTYNECIINPEDNSTTTDDDLVFTIKSCPEGFLFDPKTKFCSKTCSVFKKKRKISY